MVNESHSTEIATSRNAGHARLIDFDNSPNKTFTYLPSTQSTDDPAAQRNAFNGNTARNQASNARSNELISCLNQCNDYTPSLVRFIERRQEDKRNNVDLRFDFKVNNELTVFAKGSYARRKVDDTNMTLALGGLNVNPAVTVSPTYQGAAWTDNASGMRSAVPGSAYYLYDDASSRAQVATARGAVANVDPRSVMVDANHHVPQFSISDANANTDQADPALYAIVRPAGAATVAVPAGANVPVAIPAYIVNQQPLSTQAPQLQFSPKMAETEERTAMADFSYALGASAPFFSRIKAGFNLRETAGSSWGAGGYEAVDAIGQFSRPAG